jgi:phosphatidate cytidylyltransferase
MQARMEAAPAPQQNRRAVLLRRSLSTLSLWAVVTVAVASGQAWACAGLLGVVTVVATVEYFRMLRAGGVACFPRFGMLLASTYVVVLCVWLLREPGGGREVPSGMDVAAVFAAMVGPFVLQLRYPIRGFEALLAVAASMLGFVYVALMFSFSVRLMFLPEGEGPMPGLWVLVWAVAVTKFTDMGAYIVGSAIGRHKMIPHVSPGKTWQGFGGAMAFALLAGCGLYRAASGRTCRTLPPDSMCSAAGRMVIGLSMVLRARWRWSATWPRACSSAASRRRRTPGQRAARDRWGARPDRLACASRCRLLYFYLTWVMPGVRPDKPRRVVLLGATGSIGCSTLEVARQLPERKSNWSGSPAQRAASRECSPSRPAKRVLRHVAIADPSERRRNCRAAAAGRGARCMSGTEGLVELATLARGRHGAGGDRRHRQACGRRWPRSRPARIWRWRARRSW